MEEQEKTTEELKKEINDLKAEVMSWRSAWHLNRLLIGKSYWDGVAWGFTMGTKNNTDYHLAGKQSEIARCISLLIEDRRYAFREVGLEIADDDELEDLIIPLTYYVSIYNTGDQILFQYINGKRTVARIKTHDGWVCNGDSQPIKDPKVDVWGQRIK